VVASRQARVASPPLAFPKLRQPDLRLVRLLLRPRIRAKAVFDDVGDSLQLDHDRAPLQLDGDTIGLTYGSANAAELPTSMLSGKSRHPPKTASTIEMLRHFRAEQRAIVYLRFAGRFGSIRAATAGRYRTLGASGQDARR